MRADTGKSELRRTGKGFILINIDGLAGRRLTDTFVDQSRNTYIKVNGELTLLTAEHNFIAVD